MPKSFILSDEIVNDRGSRILTSGIDLDRFKKNPIMLWMHRRDDGWDFSQVLPIGKWENIRIEDDKLMADPVFDENDKFATLIRSKVENDLIKGCSIGINPKEFSEDPKFLVKGQTRATITKCELYEASIVDLPSNKNTVRLFSASEQTEVPLLKIDQMAETQKNEGSFSFKNENELISFMKEKFGIEPGEQNKEKNEDFAFKSESSFFDRVKELFGLQPKDKEPEKNTQKSATEPGDIERLKTELQVKDSKIEELNTEIQRLKSTDGASDPKTKNVTDSNHSSGPRDESFKVYASAKEAWDAVNDLVE